MASAVDALCAGGTIGIAPHSLRAVTLDDLRWASRAWPARPAHIHVAEQEREVADCLAAHGRRPIDLLLDTIESDTSRWCLVHATHADAAELKRMAAAKAVAGLCPITEANLGDGIFDAPTILAHGGLFGVGTDSNVEITAPGELKLLEYSQRLALRARNVFPAKEGQSTGLALYRGALAGGARALGRQIGRIEKGFRADFVVLDGTATDLACLKDDRWLDAYLFVAGMRAIRQVYVGGVAYVKDGRHVAHEAIARRYRATMARLSAL